MRDLDDPGKRRKHRARIDTLDNAVLLAGITAADSGAMMGVFGATGGPSGAASPSPDFTTGIGTAFSSLSPSCCQAHTDQALFATIEALDGGLRRSAMNDSNLLVADFLPPHAVP